MDIGFTEKYRFFIFFLFNFYLFVQSSTTEIKFKNLIQGSLTNTQFSEFLPTLTCIKSPNVFSIFDEKNNNKFIIKGIQGVSCMRESFCSEFAKKAGLDDVIISTDTIPSSNENIKLFISQYCYFNEKNNAVSLDRALRNAQGTFVIENNDFITKNKDKLWRYEDTIKEWLFPLLEQLNFQKILIFSFLTFQLDLNDTNLFVKMKSDNAMELQEFDFELCMSEIDGSDFFKKYGIKIFNNLAFYRQMPFLLRKDVFRKQLEQLPSIEIKKLVNNKIKDINFDDLFNDFDEEIKEIDKKSFYSRINDLVNALNKNNNKSIGEIVEELFESRYPFNTFPEVVKKKKARQQEEKKQFQTNLLKYGFGVGVISVLGYLFIKNLEKIKAKLNLK